MEQKNAKRPESTFSADKPAPVATKPEPSRPAADAEHRTEKASLAELVQVWPEILEDLKSNAAVWVVVNAARPAEINGDVLTLEFGDQLFVDRFKEKPASGNAVFEELREAIIGAIGVRFRFIPRTGPGLRSVPNQQTAPAEPKAQQPAESATAKANEPAKETAPAPVPEQPAGETEEIPEPTRKMPKLDEEAVGDVVIQGILGGKIVKTIPNTEATKNADESTEMDSPMFNFDAKESE
jgi:DNA polymerase-3 subunit gamma/tau